MIILGLDPGSLHTGYGFVERQGSRLRAVTHGRISCPGDMALPVRLARLARDLRDLLREHRPDAVALEALFRGVNTKSLIVLAQARGALLATVASEGWDVAEYSPSEVKSAVTGSGRADKQQVARMVKLILGLGETRMSADASDALAVSICYAQRLRMDSLEERASRFR